VDHGLDQLGGVLRYERELRLGQWEQWERREQRWRHQQRQHERREQRFEQRHLRSVEHRRNERK
jgi:hypothetical protein